MTGLSVEHRWQTFSFFLAAVFVVLLGLLFALTRNFLYIGLAGLSIFIARPMAKSFLKSVEKISPISIDSEGVRTYDGFGIPASVKWSEIKRIRKINFLLGVKWLLLDDGRPYLRLAGLPIFVENKSEILRQVISQAGPDHVLVQELVKNGF